MRDYFDGLQQQDNTRTKNVPYAKGGFYSGQETNIKCRDIIGLAAARVPIATQISSSPRCDIVLNHSRQVLGSYLGKA